MVKRATFLQMFLVAALFVIICAYGLAVAKDKLMLKYLPVDYDIETVIQNNTSNPLQVFQTNNPKRWKRFLWFFRFLMLFIVLSLIVLIYSVFQKSASKGLLYNKNREQIQGITDEQIEQGLSTVDYENLD